MTRITLNPKLNDFQRKLYRELDEINPSFHVCEAETASQRSAWLTCVTATREEAIEANEKQAEKHNRKRKSLTPVSQSEIYRQTHAKRKAKAGKRNQIKKQQQ